MGLPPRPARIVAKVWYDPGSNPRFPWFYTIDAYSLTFDEEEPANIDYGSVGWKSAAVGCVSWVLHNREQVENSEFYHVPRRVLMHMESLAI